MRKRRFNPVWLVFLPVLAAAILIAVSQTGEKDVCSQGFRQYESHTPLGDDQYLTVLDQSGQPITISELVVTGCIPGDTLLTDKVVEEDLQGALDATVAYHHQRIPFTTQQEATSFLVAMFEPIISSDYPAFFKTRDTSLIFELKSEGIPIPTPSPRLS